MGSQRADITALSSEESLTQDQRTLAKEARALAETFSSEYWLERERTKAYPMEFFQRFADQGWLSMMLPADVGGGGLGLLEASLMLYEVAASGASMSGCSTLHFSIFPPAPVIRHGSPRMREQYLPRLASGELRMCFALTEPTAGTDTSRITTRAERLGDRWVVHGQKVWTSNAQNSQRMLLLARTSPRDETRPLEGMTLFFTDLDRERCTLREIDKLGRYGMDSNELFIDGLEIGDEDIVGEVGKGFSYLLDGLNPERIVTSFEAIGSGRAALALAAEYANERVVFGKPIGANQAISHPLAKAWAHLDAAELVAMRAARLYDQGLPCGREANTAKFLAAEAAFEAADAAVQSHGGYGYAREYHVERMWRDIRLFRLAPLSQELALNYLSNKVLGLPK
jgi:alkylation response protein AidB-like acyl-CoA dehydrogenase